MRKVEEFFYPEVPSIPVDMKFERSISDFCSRFYAISEYKPLKKSSIEKELLGFCDRENILVYRLSFAQGLVSYGRNARFAVIGIGTSMYDMDERWKSEAILAHEIGHYLDYKLNFDFHGEKMTEFGTFRMELVAWDFAFRILEHFGFSEWDKAFEYASHCLKGYFDNNCDEGFDLDEAIEKLFERVGNKVKTNKFEMA